MKVEELTALLGWCAVINIGVLLYWTLFLRFAPDWIYNMTKSWVSINREQFDSNHFILMGGYKLAIILFNIAPYFALRIVF